MIDIKAYYGLTSMQQLNLFRNLHYNDGNATENGIIANAINDILPVVRKPIGKEVIRALECCANGECDECPYQDNSPCKEYLNNAALDLINRQRAEIESLTQNNISTKYPNSVLCSKGVIFTKSLEDYDNLIGDISAEAVKEFAERLHKSIDDFRDKREMVMLPYTESALLSIERKIDNLVKEFTEEKKE